MHFLEVGITNPYCTHALLEISTDTEWPNSSGTFLTVGVIRWNKDVGNSKKEELSFNN